MQDSSHLTIILCSSVIIMVISHKQKVNRKDNNTSSRLCNKFLNKKAIFCLVIRKSR
jgi:hypothetical protein